jgi:hypothetical protein
MSGQLQDDMSNIPLADDDPQGLLHDIFISISWNSITPINIRVDHLHIT